MGDKPTTYTARLTPRLVGLVPRYDLYVVQKAEGRRLTSSGLGVTDLRLITDAHTYLRQWGFTDATTFGWDGVPGAVGPDGYAESNLTPAPKNGVSP